MQNLFLAKILKDQNETLIFTDGTSYALMSSFNSSIKTFSDFLNFVTDFNDLSLIKMTLPLPSDSTFLHIIEDQNIFATGCSFEWNEEKLQKTADSDPYKKIYQSERSMFFYKGSKKNLSLFQGSIGIRPDSNITIPEAEIVVVFNSSGKIIGYTLGNDVTAVDIEKQNPLYQMQAKFYKHSVSLLPLVALRSELPMTHLKCKVFRNGECISETGYSTESFNRDVKEIVDQLMKLKLTQEGGFLLLGCGSSYPKDKGLIPKDIVRIEADFMPIQLENFCSLI